MRFYNRQHQYYCGIDLHVKTMDVCILDPAGQVLVHRNVPSTPAAFLEVVAPYRTDLVVAVECMFTWYWLADRCAGYVLRRGGVGGAEEGTRTPTVLPPLGPEPSASTNFATSARGANSNSITVGHQ